MTIFNPNLLREIVDNYFGKYPINNYYKYSSEFFVLLSELFNEICDSEFYLNDCNAFLNLNYYINFNELLDNKPELLEYQPIILLYYKILEQLNLSDPDIIVNDLVLTNEINNNNNFTFLTKILNNINSNRCLEKINVDFENTKLH